MRNKILLGILSVVLLASFVAAAATVTYGWLTPGEPVAFDADGSAVAGYFAGGEGTKEKPYLLTTPRHVYNLAWLQYLGTFNDTKEVNGETALVQQYYFKLENNIDMSTGGEWQVIPPIGTAEYPFVGSFDGNGCIISNAIISNKVGMNEITAKPPAVDDVRDVEIIGFFGIIGTYNEKGLVSKDQLKDLGVHDLLLDNVTVQTSTTKTLAGLFAGFVNGNLTNVHVTTGTIIARAGASTLSADNVLSAYSLIGDYDTTKINWEGGPMDGPTADSDTNAGFGGSIDMVTLAKRLSYMYGVTPTTTTSGYSRPNSEVMTGNNAYVSKLMSAFSHTATSAQVLFINDGAYLPLNIEGTDSDSFGQDQYTTTKFETAKSDNTGYIVGLGAVTSARGKPINLSNRRLGQLCHSIAGNQNNWSSMAYSGVDSQVQILTKDAEGTYYVIGDNLNKLTSASDPYDVYKNVGVTVKTFSQLGLTQYDGETANRVRTKLGEMLSDTTTTNNMIYGIQIADSPAPSASGLLTLSSGKTVTLGNAERTVSTLVKGTIHFGVQKPGVITMVAATANTFGTISNYAAGCSLPMLYEVDRSSGSVALHAIQAICKDSSGNLINYYYQSNGEPSLTEAPTGQTIVYNYETMGTLTTYGSGGDDLAYMQSLFYFEIPVNAGEYVLGGSGHTTNSNVFILYLDVGANAGSQGGGGGGNGGVANPTGTLSGVYFVDKDGKPLLQDITPDEGKTAPAVAFQVVLTGTEAKISFDGKVTGVIVTTPPASNVTVTQVVPPSEEDETTGT